MAVQLKAWLADTFEWQLVLGNHWLHERHEKKKLGVKPERDRAWEGLYHDNGSCLDIANYIHPEVDSPLHVLQTQPWTLTDGRCRVVAHLTPDCAQDFTIRYPAYSCLAPGSTIAVRRYTIRYTSYGPPRSRFHFLLHQIDWLGECCQTVCDLHSRELPPVYCESAVVTAQKQVDDTRTREDRRCLSRSEAQVDDIMADTMDESHDVPDSTTSPVSQMPYTQAAFGTQIQHPIRMRADEPQVLGVTRLEPVMAGNTQRIEIRQGADDTMQERLLGLLGRVPNQAQRNTNASSQPRFVQSAFGRKKSADKAAESSLEPAIESSNQGAHGSTTESKDAQDPPALPKRRENSNKAASLSMSKDREPTKSAPAVGEKDAHIDSEENTATAPECSWMKGFIFDSETLKVSSLQQQCLAKDASWLKPQPGCPPFQDGNMPQSILQTLHRIADERASIQDDGNSDAESDIDPSPDSVPVGTNLSAESVPQTTQDDDDSSAEISSWSQSPEQPPKPANRHLDLPPDSSADSQMPGMESPPKTQSSPLNKRSRHPEVIDISDDKSTQPQSSPPVAQNPANSDDDMEMEESVPQALGDDIAENDSPSNSIPDVLSPKPNRSQSIVQVRETPYGKGKTAQLLEHAPTSKPISTQAQNSSGESKDTSSTSIIQSTYDMPDAASSVEIVPSRTDKAKTPLKQQARDPQEREEMHGRVAKHAINRSPRDVQMHDGALVTEATASMAGIEGNRRISEDLLVKEESTSIQNMTLESVKSPQKEPHSELPLNTPQPTSGSTKRKLQVSPAKSNRRHTKRREIKIVGFGDNSPVTVDPVTRLHDEREEFLRRFRENRNSSTGFESRSETTRTIAAEHGADAMDLDNADRPYNGMRSISRSPRHQSLYADPSPVPVHRTGSTQSQRFYEEAQSREEVQISPANKYPTQSKQPRGASILSDQYSHVTVFDSFKAAYPEYKGDTKHFHNQCKQIYILDLEDKMVPKWQWDDFIIRNRTDYRDYAMDCLDRGENAEPYHRFYKDCIRDTLYRKGIVEGRMTLEKAFEEAGITLEDSDTLTSPPRKQLPTRKSLPSSFSQIRKPRQDHITSSHARPRHSLPSSSHAHPSASKHARPQAQTRLAREISPPNRPEASESTGDPYRDYIHGLQRMTSWTGSNKVNPNKSWPRNLDCRPSIEHVPKRKVDVLLWSDVLSKEK
ncbi:hypothetical protein COCCADRAFT_35434 [Bipolaris zeicola 26-R-13]|uniref:Uncharacterized protein n=1 Tax=Cochliobolus carbonum (strain 26-R-13) TaxID=930089 RepID=W6YBM5_COCC2|nr:uncharacterized protein COCCADRAFT_35434 [Bipolaris zeicola 26-R-13]EUC34980.1 hypothetical protein COCCADRAFT_35434 [Bipolaris zeicola 26-R-13]